MPASPRETRRFTPGRTGDARPLGQLEAAVMEVLWRALAAVSVADVHVALQGQLLVAYNTVKTTMERLASKGILTRSKEGKAYLYQAALSREELERRIVATVLDRLVEAFPQAITSFFVRPDTTLTDEQLAILQEALERRRREQDA